MNDSRSVVDRCTSMDGRWTVDGRSMNDHVPRVTSLCVVSGHPRCFLPSLMTTVTVATTVRWIAYDPSHGKSNTNLCSLDGPVSIGRTTRKRFHVRIKRNRNSCWLFSKLDSFVEVVNWRVIAINLYLFPFIFHASAMLYIQRFFHFHFFGVFPNLEYIVKLWRG